MRRSLVKGKRVVFIDHRKELIDQTSRTLDKYGIEHGIIASGVEPNYELPIQIASVQTLVRRLEQVSVPDFLIVDECHHIEAATYKKIVEKWNCYLLGLTATPIRMGGRTLHDSFDALVEGSTVKELIELGYLTRYKYVAYNRPEFSELRIGNDNEFTNKSMSRVMDRLEVIGDVTKSYVDHAFGLKTICYCVNIKHSEHQAEDFNAHGIRAAHIDANTPKSKRAEIIEQFRRNEITVLCNVDLFGEGFDVPDVECVILARPTRSLTIYIQQTMRALRPAPSNPNKKAIILDHGGNYKRLGELTKSRHWSLKPNKEKDVEKAPKKVCPRCGNIVVLGAIACPICGYQFLFYELDELKRDELDELKRDGFDKLKLVEAESVTIFEYTPRSKELEQTAEYYRQLAEQKHYKKYWAACRTTETTRNIKECEAVASMFDYNKGWAHHRWKELRQQRRAKK